jgi:diguanylate cyclase (GGDEF)-like protein
VAETLKMNQSRVMRLLQSYRLRVLCICFIGTHIPLMVASVHALSSMNGGLSAHYGILVAVLVATLVGTGLTLFAVNAVLSPIMKSATALKAYTTDRTLPNLPLDRRDEAGDLMATVHLVCTRLESELRRQEQLASTDALTGLPNRRAFLTESVELMNASRRTRQPLHFVLLDLDHFKSLNDVHGHAVGDEALRRFAQALRDELPSGSICGRVGGEEFAVLVPSELRGALALAERILHRTRAIDLGLSPRRDVTVSIGITAVDVAKEALIEDGAFERADRALYQSKEHGRDQVSVAA